MLLDRLEERAALDRLLEDMEGERSDTLVLVGAPGVGKTTLLDYAAGAAAPETRIIRISAVEPELGLAFGGLHQLLLPFVSRIGLLPLPQRRALRSALGLGAGSTPDRFLVGLAVLTLLSEEAVERSLLIIVDDAHWLDDETTHVLAFVARRLEADRIGLVFSISDDSPRPVPFESLPTLEVGGLPEPAARELLENVGDLHVDERASERIMAATGGNPLALVELSAELSAAHLIGGAPLPDPLPIRRQLEERFQRRVMSLPPDTQRLLLLAAADPTGDPRLLWQAANDLGIENDAAAAAESDGLLSLQPTVAFRHPLIRSAVYAGVSPADRRTGHAALAACTDPDTDPDRRAWHQALATLGPDERVAGELERGASRARARGGHAASAAFLERAAALTPDLGRRAERQLAAAEAEVTGGAPRRAAELLDEANPRLLTPLSRARALRLRGEISFATDHATTAAEFYLPAARALEPLDERLARETLLEALLTATLAGNSDGVDGTVEIARAARTAAKRSTREPTVADLLLEGLSARVIAPYAEAAPPLRRAVELLRGGAVDDDTRLRWLGVGWVAASELWEEEARETLAKQWARLAREQGALTRLSQALTVLGISEAWAGRLDASDACFAERREIDMAIGFTGAASRAYPHQVIVLAWRGREAETRTLAEAAMVELTERGQTESMDFIHYALSVLDVGLGRYQAAIDSALHVLERDPPYSGVRALPELVEAAVRTGDRDLAGKGLQRLSERALASGSPWALGLLARCKAQLAEDEAESLYREAIERLGGRLLAPELARAHLLYGEWLRRGRRRTDAREQLRVALETFERIGGEAFAERARTELLATGARAPKRHHEARTELTPQESRVAALAAEGATNSEIGAQLFISASTVEYHLRKVFRKLGVRSRTQLARVLLETEAAGRMTAPAE
jgi:DNA-binding NarL/FixJ family response regulator/energy-coupling factor transporter ATP-binding protein EcfA2